jgi:predicted RNase H-like HicB family nuclease
MSRRQPLRRAIKAFINRGEDHYVAECLDISVVTQGRTIDETLGNLQEAVALHLDGENLEELGFVDNPALIVTLEIEPSPRAA